MFAHPEKDGVALGQIGRVVANLTSRPCLVELPAEFDQLCVGLAVIGHRLSGLRDYSVRAGQLQCKLNVLRHLWDFVFTAILD